MSDVSNVIEDISTIESEAATHSSRPNIHHYTAETLAFLIAKERIAILQKKTRDELKELRQRQNKVKFLHQLLKAVNSATDAKGNFDCSKNTEFQRLLKEAEQLGVEVAKDEKNNLKVYFSKEDKERLVENIRVTCEDLNFQNDMQIQEISRLTNERYESYQMARSIMKPLHDDKINKARSVAGRG